MATNSETALKLLKGELQFLESGDFKYCPRSPWCAPQNFNEYPTCTSRLVDFDVCKECWLMQFIPPEHREEEIPCRFVQLTADGASVDSLCRFSTPLKTEEILRCWLQLRIHELGKPGVTPSGRCCDCES